MNAITNISSGLYVAHQAPIPSVPRQESANLIVRLGWNARNRSFSHVSGCGPLHPRQTRIVGDPRLEFVGSALALIRDPLALVRSMLTFVGDPVSFARAAVLLIKLVAQLLQPGSLRTRALSTLARPPSGAALLDGTIRPSDLLEPLSVLLGQSSALLEHLGRSHEQLEKAL